MKKFFFCPECKKSLRLAGNPPTILSCDFCNISFPYKNEIAIFKKDVPKFIEDYWENCDSIFKNGQIESHLKEFFPENTFFQNMLDLGCGDGRSTEPVHMLADTVFCLDSSYACLLKLKARNLGNTIGIQGDGKSIPFPDDFFDCVVSLSVVEHIPRESLNKFLTEVHRILKKRGTFLVRNDAWFYGVLEKLRIRPGQYGNTPDITHVSMMRGKTLYNELKKANFEITKEDHFPFYRVEKKFGLSLPIFFTRFFSTHSNFICQPIK